MVSLSDDDPLVYLVRVQASGGIAEVISDYAGLINNELSYSAHYFQNMY